MTVQTIGAIKNYFETGDMPTQQQFSDLIETLGVNLQVISFVSGANSIQASAADLTFTGYTQGLGFQFKATGTNSGPVTININNQGSVAIQKLGTALNANDITTGDMVSIISDGTNFQMVSPARSQTYSNNSIPVSALSGFTANNVIRSTGVSAPPVWGKLELQTDVSGVLPSSNGGTGFNTYAQGDIIIASAANTLSRLQKDTNATRYLSNTGTNNNPLWAQVNLANGVTGNLAVTNLASGSGATGTTFWRGDGTWATPVGGSTPGWVPIKTILASAVAAVDFVNGTSGVVLDGTYKKYAVAMANIIPANDGVDFYFRTSSNGGVSYDNGASDYTWGFVKLLGGGTVSQVTDTADNQIYITEALGTGTGENQGGIIYIDNPASTTAYKVVRFQTGGYQASPNVVANVGSGVRLSSSAVNAIRFAAQNGNINGVFTLLGFTSAA